MVHLLFEGQAGGYSVDTAERYTNLHVPATSGGPYRVFPQITERRVLQFKTVLNIATFHPTEAPQH